MKIFVLYRKVKGIDYPIENSDSYYSTLQEAEKSYMRAKNSDNVISAKLAKVELDANVSELLACFSK